MLRQQMSPRLLETNTRVGFSLTCVLRSIGCLLRVPTFCAATSPSGLFRADDVPSRRLASRDYSRAEQGAGDGRPFLSAPNQKPHKSAQPVGQSLIGPQPHRQGSSLTWSLRFGWCAGEAGVVRF